MRYTKKDLDKLVDYKLSQMGEYNAADLSNAVLSSIIELTDGNSLMIKWFGSFKCVRAKAKEIPNVKNPQETLIVKEHNRIYFKAGKLFKDFINEDEDSNQTVGGDIWYDSY